MPIFLAHFLASASSDPLLVSVGSPSSPRAAFMRLANWFSNPESKPPLGAVVVVAGTVVVVVAGPCVAEAAWTVSAATATMDVVVVVGGAVVVVNRGSVVEVVDAGAFTKTGCVDVVDVAGAAIRSRVDGLGSGTCAATSG